MKQYLQYMALLMIAYILSAVSTGKSQPSGGPYGPIRRTYEVPVVSGRIWYVSTDGDSTVQGRSAASPTRIESAIKRARTGDAIVMRGGTYRTGNLILNQGITIQPFGNERPILKGTLIAEKWQNLGNGLWATKWKRLFPSEPADWWQRDREGKRTPLCRFNNDMVFVDGRFLQSVGWEGDVDSNTYYIDYQTGTVYIGQDPANHLVEITAYDAAIVRTIGRCNGLMADRKGYVIRGITFTQYAYRALEVEGKEPEGVADEASFGKEVVGTTLEDCSVTFTSRVAGYFRGDSLVLRRCRISDTSTEGIYIIASNDVLLEGNIFQRNNIESITGYYPAAVKIFNQCHRAICRDNLITDLPNSNGVWYDVGEVEGVFVNNWVENVGPINAPFSTNQLWPSDNGFFFEISKGAVVSGNVFVNCDHGLMILNSSNVRVYQNTFFNSMACIGRNARTVEGDRFGWHSTTGPDVDKREGHEFVNNLLASDKRFMRPLLFVWQPASLCDRLPGSQLNRLDHDAYVHGIQSNEAPLILWSPAQNAVCQSEFNSLRELRTYYPGFEASGHDYPEYAGPLFKSPELKDFRLLADFLGGLPGDDSSSGCNSHPRKARIAEAVRRRVSTSAVRRESPASRGDIRMKRLLIFPTTIFRLQ